MSFNFIDSHAHLTLKHNLEELKILFLNFEKNNILDIIDIGLDIPDIESRKKILNTI